MAKFEGVKWAPHQMRYLLPDKQFDILESDAKIAAVSRSVFYATFLCFEGVRFFCKKGAGGRLEVNFLNWHRNLERLRRGIAFNLSQDPGRDDPVGRGARDDHRPPVFQGAGHPGLPRGDGRPRRPGLPPAVHRGRRAVHGGDVPRSTRRPGPLLPLRQLPGRALHRRRRPPPRPGRGGQQDGLAQARHQLSHQPEGPRGGQRGRSGGRGGPVPRRPDARPSGRAAHHRVGFLVLPVRPARRDGHQDPRKRAHPALGHHPGHGHDPAGDGGQGRGAPRRLRRASPPASKPTSSSSPPASARPGS